MLPVGTTVGNSNESALEADGAARRTPRESERSAKKRYSRGCSDRRESGLLPMPKRNARIAA